MSTLGGRARRTAKLARLSASAGARSVTARRRRRGDGGEAAFAAAHDEVAETIFRTLGEMKGAAMKVGQMLSFVDLDLDPELNRVYQGRLAALTDSAPPSDPEAIAAVLEGEYGAPVDRVFAWWDPEPLAVASIGQVHRATLPTGEEVVLKVQHPGVAEAVEADLSSIELLAPVARLVNPNVDARALLVELRERVVEELDYQQEAAYQEAFAERYAGHPFVRVPEVHREYSRPRVLCTGYVDGLRFGPMLAQATTAERDRYGEIIFRFVFGSLYRFRMFNSDPHPGNFLFPGDGTVAFIDYGSCKVFTREARTRLREVHRAVADDDHDRLGPALAAAGILPPGSDPDLQVVLGWFRLAYEPMAHDAPYTYNAGYARRLAASSSDPDSPYIANLRKLHMPPEYLLLNRIQFGVNSLLAKLGPTANWQRIMYELYEDGSPTTPLGEAERPWYADHPLAA
jgi:predicted unusual protein kinase regulating ubiquinone biosynthesis (AarF/ABC1/UbiB family)